MPEFKSVNGKWVPVDAAPAAQEKAVIKEEPKPEVKVEEPKVERPRRARKAEGDSNTNS